MKLLQAVMSVKKNALHIKQVKGNIHDQEVVSLFQYLPHANKYRILTLFIHTDPSQVSQTQVLIEVHLHKFWVLFCQRSTTLTQLSNQMQE